VVDPTLQVQPWVTGLNGPTGIAFFGNGNAFAIEKGTGQVKLIQNQTVVGTVLDLPVANDSERGLLGIALHPNFANNGFVYLYHTASDTDGGTATGNLVDRYHWDGSSLQFNRSILTLPAAPGPNHDGGRILFGPDRKLYAVIGDQNRRQATQNVQGRRVRPAGAVFRVNGNGTVPTDNPFFDPSRSGVGGAATNRIFAYGVRNSFGLAFDPVTGSLWDSEPGVDTFDEINRIVPGFNSGWVSIMGPRSRNGGTTGPLVSLGPAAKYRNPKFSWATSLTPTALHFLPSSVLGSNNTNDLFVGTAETGTLFRFQPNAGRGGLLLTGDLSDKVADNSPSDVLGEQNDIVFGSGFGVITDITSTDQGLFLLSLDQGTLYRVSPIAGARAMLGAAPRPSTSIPEPAMLAPILLASAALLRRRHRQA
jgi:glucose/arabinose dehydrogenase